MGLVIDGFPFTIRWIEIDGRPIRYVDEGTGPVLLFVHAGVWSFHWRDLIVRLRSRYRCVTLDLPGVGRSRASEGDPLGLEDASMVLGSFVRALDLRDVTPVLHGLGGPVALGAASRLVNRIRGMALVEAVGWPLGPDGWEAFGRPFPERDVTRANDYLRGVDLTLRTELRDRPVVLVFGAESPTVTAGIPDGWRARFPDALLLLVAGGHRFPMIDSPDLVAGALRSWWSDEVVAA